ncbi:MAG: glycoside hydrolase family 3 N-terminal domain-containing protein [Acholeplasmataceae bacterium]|nr:glycoside hydrolase family 3 N-terminal domain-containing protein [Acholeplasmataceae bacterium]
MDIIKLLKKLTIEEKIGQLLQLSPFHFIKDIEVEVFGNVKELGLTEKKIFSAGSVLGIHNAAEMIAVQEKYLRKSTHQIPLIFMADVIHGYETIFPVPLAISSSWNPKLAFDTARVSAIEASSAGIHVTFSPMADLTRDPRWGRVVEGFGEDPYLNAVFTKEMVKGYQQGDISKDENIASCVKHFAAYGAAEGGRDYNTVDVSRLSLHNYYLKGYKAAIDAGAKLIMTSFNVIDGIPATINKHLLRDVLRDLWKFEGLTITDYDSLHQVVPHGNAENDREAAQKGLIAGLDIEMASSCYINYLKMLIENNEVSIELLDEAVLRVLKLKEEIGLFENPYKGASVEKESRIIRSNKHLEISKNVALESAVLLKNDGVLPLSKNKKYALIGPYAETKNTNGPWSWHGKNELNHTLKEKLEEQGIILSLVREVNHINELSNEEQALLKKADAVIFALGENERESGEAHSKVDIKIPRNQEKFIEFAKEQNLDSIIVLYHGRPFDLSNILSTNAILDVYYLGSMANDAIADLLTGLINPSGKLTMSYPRHVGQIPIYYNYLNTGRPKVEGDRNEYVSYYLDELNTPLFPFGYGLSYSKFRYDNLVLSKNEMYFNEEITVSVDVHNESEIGGFETIELYIRDYVASISRPVKELKGFQKIWFAPHQRRTVEFKIKKDSLSYLNAEGLEILEPGRFSIMVGSSSDHLLCLDLICKKEVSL